MFQVRNLRYNDTLPTVYWTIYSNTYNTFDDVAEELGIDVKDLDEGIHLYEVNVHQVDYIIDAACRKQPDGWVQIALVRETEEDPQHVLICKTQDLDKQDTDPSTIGMTGWIRKVLWPNAKRRGKKDPKGEALRKLSEVNSLIDKTGETPERKRRAKKNIVKANRALQYDD